MRLWGAARRVGGEPLGSGTHLFLKELLTMALSTRRSPTCDGPRKWNISMACSVGWARHRRLQGEGVTPWPAPHVLGGLRTLPDHPELRRPQKMSPLDFNHQHQPQEGTISRLR